MQTVDPKGNAWTVKCRWLPRYEGRGLRERLRQRPRRAEKRKSDREPRWYDWLDFPDIADSAAPCA